MEYYISVGLIALAAILTAFASVPTIKVLQLSGYKARGVVAWWKGTAFDAIVRYASLMLFGFITTLVFVACMSSFEYVRYCGVAFYCIFALLFIVFGGKGGSNKIKFTGRVMRLLVVDTVIMLGLGACVAYATYYSMYCQTVIAALAMFAPFVAIVANFVTYPFEKLNNRRYIKRAKRKLAQRKPIVIGITGSYGKTTAKNMLVAMLKDKYTVLATPGSFNTPMGICLTVNNNSLDEQVFIAELGARYRGDIKELCDIVSPKYGIITAVGDMHIQTMGSRAGVADTKFELASALPSDGLLVLNGYNEDCAALASRDTACEKMIAGKDGVTFDNLKFGASGTAFDMHADGANYPVTAKLLGAHVPQLVCTCATLALRLGADMPSIVRAVAEMQPVEHRLQLLPTDTPSVTVIDDAYNSNPVGAKNALDVLAMFDGSKVVITPGFVELGGIEKRCNTELGAQIAEKCDYAFLVGSRGADIKKGAVKAGMDESRIMQFASRGEAVDALKSVGGAVTVLFENDLPDNIK